MAPQPIAPLTHSKPLLNIYYAFRIGLGFILLLLFLSGRTGKALGGLYPDVFFWTCGSWIVIATLSLAVFPAHKLVHSLHRITSFLVLDVIALLLLIHASGGVDSGFGYLLLVIVAISSIFMRQQMAIMFATMVSLLMLAQTLYLVESLNLGAKPIFSAVVLGLLLFITAFTFQRLTQKIQLSTEQAIQQRLYAEHLQRLAQAIVARMRTGIIVLDKDNKIELMNTAASQLLGATASAQLDNTPALSQLKKYLIADDEPHLRQQRSDAGLEVRFSRAQLNVGEDNRQVIFVEDTRTIAQQAQQLKLASLGRLTASIAHEIRNPLGAISHAVQLLQESEAITQVDKRLCDIIYQHAKRVNQIIENTLALSRRKDPQISLIDLHPWLEQFISNYTSHQQANISLKLEPGPLPLRIDTTNLQQILVNLVDNGLRYSKQQTGEAKLLLRGGINQSNDNVFLEVIDFGPGIEGEQLAQIFEPFFTTEELGTGLGLYICKELCEINQASLYYFKTTRGESCFRIDFPHHLRMI
ncbi:MAG TPA: ATP-binding protein [Cellvibrionaceae bacterium]|nr:ATP-binding protein [Cellvibrionaceae bacterium]